MRSPSYWLVSQEIARNGTRTVLFTRRLSFHLLFTSKIRDREEGIVIYSFYIWFSFLTWVWVNIFLEIVSRKTATTHIFQSGVRNWPASVSRREIEVFNPQAWELAGIFLSELLWLSFKLKLILKPAILLKLTHFQLCIENKQLRLLIVLGLPHILTVIYVFNKRFY